VAADRVLGYVATMSMTTGKPDRFTAALERIDAANAADPTGEALLYGQRMSQTLDDFLPGAAEHLKIAARAQHIRRWEIPRDSYPLDRKGYHLWRTRLYEFHADAAEEILRAVGYDEAFIGRVRDLLMKKRIKADEEMQTLEDVICLVFLRWYYAVFIADHEDATVITILQRTWKKMSERGHEAALKLELSGRGLELVKRALSGEQGAAHVE
jgi:hypothetical protein